MGREPSALHIANIMRHTEYIHTYTNFVAFTARMGLYLSMLPKTIYWWQVNHLWINLHSRAVIEKLCIANSQLPHGFFALIENRAFFYISSIRIISSAECLIVAFLKLFESFISVKKATEHSFLLLNFRWLSV